jgi:hypothetical protein
MIVLREQGGREINLDDSRAHALAEALWMFEPGRGAFPLAVLLTTEVRLVESARKGIDLDPRQSVLVDEALGVLAD